MTTGIHDYVIQQLDRCYTAADKDTRLEEVSRATGVAESTMYKMWKGIIANPGINKVEPLYFYFRKTEGRRLRQRA